MSVSFIPTITHVLLIACKYPERTPGTCVPGLEIFLPKICHSHLTFQIVKRWQWPLHCGRHSSQMLFTKGTWNLWHMLLKDFFFLDQNLNDENWACDFKGLWEAIWSEKWRILDLKVVLGLIDIECKCSSVATFTHFEYFSFYNQRFTVSLWEPRNNPL